MMMSKLQFLTILVTMVISLGFSIVINKLLLKFSKNLGMRNLDKKEEIRWSSVRKPALGGISFFLCFLISFAMLGLIPHEENSVLPLLGIAGASTLGFLLGLADDAYNTNPLVKIFGQITCAFILIVTGIVLPVTSSEPLNFIFTIVWVIGMMNSINMLDNMDGVSTSISISIILGMISYEFYTGDINVVFTIILVGVMGGLIGFLFYNWSPSSMYMGDTGSMFLGVLLAGSSIWFIWNERDLYGGTFQIKQFVIPMLVFIVPLIDTTTVTIRRLMRKQSPFVGGKDHITHHLVYLGLKESTVALVLLFVSLSSIPLILLIKNNEWTIVTTILAFLYFALLFFTMQILYNKGAKLNQMKMEKDGVNEHTKNHKKLKKVS
jgi:UDP-GlcNAc:undecaprenyl-phosphate/decaprenyl-phosphate GlcNAc-1-phosphate transferase